MKHEGIHVLAANVWGNKGGAGGRGGEGRGGGLGDGG
jgi:hypothetical protein